MSACRFWELEVVVRIDLHIIWKVRYLIMHGCRRWYLVVIDRTRWSCDYVLRAWILILPLFVHHYVGSRCSWLFDGELARSCCWAIIIYLADLILVSFDCLRRFVDDRTIRFAIVRSSVAVCLLLLILNLLSSLRIIYVELLWLG